MSEKLKQNSETSNSSKWDSLTEYPEENIPRDPDFPRDPEFEDDPRQYTEEELMADPAKRYHVNPKDFPILSAQSERFVDGDRIRSRTYNVNKSLGIHIAHTADLITEISGESEEEPAYDHVIYLDKSARPVSWLVNIFWDDFSDKKRPAHSYLAIDRADWFTEVGMDTSDDGRYRSDSDGHTRGDKATFEDFKKHADKLPPETFAAVRALFIPEGIESEDPKTIMETPTPLDGKRILIVDEVGRTGATQKIAQYLVERALRSSDSNIPRAKVDTTTYWDSGVIIAKNGESDMASSPVWYQTDIEYGRGIGDRDPEYFEERYEQDPSPKNRARRLGAKVLGRPLNLAEEPGQLSRGLAKEFKKMHEEYRAGHILMRHPAKYDQEKWIEKLEGQGIVFVAQDRFDSRPIPKNAYSKISSDQNALDQS
ncbi:MAG: hypothetical protein Q4B65_02080 [Candidatus Saccharibacteria bacterium]|nr:hypothetical protein [Candidatus Saccharibacteria bacterium]